MSDSDSLFSYPDELSAADFSYPDHMPVFLDELDNSTLVEARRICGQDSQCIYDYSQTGSKEVAMITMETDQENKLGQTLSGTHYRTYICTVLLIIIHTRVY